MEYVVLYMILPIYPLDTLRTAYLICCLALLLSLVMHLVSEGHEKVARCATLEDLPENHLQAKILTYEYGIRLIGSKCNVCIDDLAKQFLGAVTYAGHKPIDLLFSLASPGSLIV